MTFQDIFKEKGLYKADSFAKGFCFKIDDNGIDNARCLFAVTYKDKDDLNPDIHTQQVYAGLFDKTYEKVYTRQSLFK